MRSVALGEHVPVPEMARFTQTLIQAEQLGISIRRILRTQADEMRRRRQAAAEERAMKAPVKMLFPTILFIFPAMFVVVLGPALLNLRGVFSVTSAAAAVAGRVRRPRRLLLDALCLCAFFSVTGGRPGRPVGLGLTLLASAHSGARPLRDGRRSSTSRSTVAWIAAAPIGSFAMLGARPVDGFARGPRLRPRQIQLRRVSRLSLAGMSAHSGGRSASWLHIAA